MSVHSKYFLLVLCLIQMSPPSNTMCHPVWPELPLPQPCGVALCHPGSDPALCGGSRMLWHLAITRVVSPPSNNTLLVENLPNDSHHSPLLFLNGSFSPCPYLYLHSLLHDYLEVRTLVKLAVNERVMHQLFAMAELWESAKTWRTQAKMSNKRTRLVFTEVRDQRDCLHQHQFAE